MDNVKKREIRIPDYSLGEEPESVPCSVRRHWF